MRGMHGMGVRMQGIRMQMRKMGVKIRVIQGIGLGIKEWGESGWKCREIIKGVTIIYFPKIFQSFWFYYIAASTLSFFITNAISLKNWENEGKKFFPKS